MVNKSEFYRALGDYLSVPPDVTITNIEEDCYYREGCPTCGGDYEFTVRVMGTDSQDKTYSQSFNGQLTDFIAGL